MKNLSLKAETRKKKEKADPKKKIPAVVYGGDLKESQVIWVNYGDFKRTYEKTGESTLVDLELKKTEGATVSHKVLIYDVQYHPLTGDYIHADFFKVTMDEELDAEVELEFVGEAPAVKELGGILVKNISTIEVRCLPEDLPGEIKVDVSSLKTFDDYVYVKDLPLGERVKIDLDPETVAVLVSPPRSESELEELDSEVESDITQVEGMKKEEPTDEGEGKDKMGDKQEPEAANNKKDKNE